MSAAPNVLEVEELRIRDRNGVLRGVFGASRDRGGCALDLFDTNGLVRVSVGVDDDGTTRIGLLNESGSVVIGLGVRESEGRLGLAVNDHQGRPAISISVHPDGCRQIDVYDEHSQLAWAAP